LTSHRAAHHGQLHSFPTRRSSDLTAAAELAGRGIRVNSVAPGPIVTPIFGRTGLSKEAVDEFAKDILGKVPMKRFGQPEEVAGRSEEHTSELQSQSNLVCRLLLEK